MIKTFNVYDVWRGAKYAGVAIAYRLFLVYRTRSKRSLGV